MIMHIPAYQIHNVLNTYSLQLFKAGSGAQNKDAGQGATFARISPETSRMAVIDKVAAEIVQRITRLDTITAKSNKPSPIPASEKETLRTEMQTIFVFNTLDIHNIKTSESLSVEDSIFLIKKDPPD